MIVSSCFGVFFPPQNLIHFRLDDMLGKLESELGMERNVSVIAKKQALCYLKRLPLGLECNILNNFCSECDCATGNLSPNNCSPTWTDCIHPQTAWWRFESLCNWGHDSTGCQLVAILFLFLCQSKVAEHLCQLNCYSLVTMSLFVEEFLKFLFFMLFADLSQ